MLFGMALSAMPVVAAFSGEPQRLTDNGKLKFSPGYRDGGREVIFAELSDPNLYRIQRLVVGEGIPTPLHPDATTSEFEPVIAADGDCYAYLKTQAALSVGIMIRDHQGTDLGELRPESGFFGYRSPALAPNRTRVAFAYAIRGAQQIVSCRFNGSDRQSLTSSSGINNWPAYSPEGRSIAFGSSRDGNFEIYVMQSDGSDPRRLTDHPLQDIRPRFSPDGKQIAFTSHRDGNAEVYVMNADGTRVRRVTDHPERDDYPDWHPDGRKLITVSERGGKHDLYLWTAPE
ncbi:MAG: hypothetical protein U0872_15110 [Planctomycetaceae bacterium]